MLRPFSLMSCFCGMVPALRRAARGLPHVAQTARHVDAWAFALP